MAVRNSDNAQPLVDGIVRFAAKGTVLPTDPTTAPTGFLDVGWLTDAGVGETPSTNTNVKRGINGSIVKTIKTDNDTSFTFETYERSKAVNQLLRPGSTPSTTGATPEVQTISISGTATGGTFTPYVPGIGSLPPQTYNVSTAALAAAFSVLVGDVVTVSGTPATSYVVTFPDSMGDVGQMTIASALTGTGTPLATAATSTPGVVGVTSTAVKSYLGTSAKAWILDYNFGLWVRRVCIPNGEAFLTGAVQDKPGDLSIGQWRIDCYPASDGTKYFDYTTNPAEAV